MSGHLNKSQSVQNADLWYRQWALQRSHGKASSSSSKLSSTSAPSTSASGTTSQRPSGPSVARTVAAAAAATAATTTAASNHDSTKQQLQPEMSATGSPSVSLLQASRGGLDRDRGDDLHARTSTVSEPVPELVDLAQDELRKRWMALQGTSTPSPDGSNPHRQLRIAAGRPKAGIGGDASTGVGASAAVGASAESNALQTPPRRQVEGARGVFFSSPQSSSKVGEALIHMKRLLDSGALSADEFSVISRQILDDGLNGASAPLTSGVGAADVISPLAAIQTNSGSSIAGSFENNTSDSGRIQALQIEVSNQQKADTTSTTMRGTRQVQSDSNSTTKQIPAPAPNSGREKYGGIAASPTTRQKNGASSSASDVSPCLPRHNLLPNSPLPLGNQVSSWTKVRSNVNLDNSSPARQFNSPSTSTPRNDRFDNGILRYREQSLALQEQSSARATRRHADTVARLTDGMIAEVHSACERAVAAMDYSRQLLLTQADHLGRRPSSAYARRLSPTARSEGVTAPFDSNMEDRIAQRIADKAAARFLATVRELGSSVAEVPQAYIRRGGQSSQTHDQAPSRRNDPGHLQIEHTKSQFESWQDEAARQQQQRQQQAAIEQHRRWQQETQDMREKFAFQQQQQQQQFLELQRQRFLQHMQRLSSTPSSSDVPRSNSAQGRSEAHGSNPMSFLPHTQPTPRPYMRPTVNAIATGPLSGMHRVREVLTSHADSIASTRSRSVGAQQPSYTSEDQSVVLEKHENRLDATPAARSSSALSIDELGHSEADNSTSRFYHRERQPQPDKSPPRDASRYGGLGMRGSSQSHEQPTAPAWPYAPGEMLTPAAKPKLPNQATPLPEPSLTFAQNRDRPPTQTLSPQREAERKRTQYLAKAMASLHRKAYSHYSTLGQEQ